MCRWPLILDMMSLLLQLLRCGCYFGAALLARGRRRAQARVAVHAHIQTECHARRSRRRVPALCELRVRQTAHKERSHVTVADPECTIALVNACSTARVSPAAQCELQKNEHTANCKKMSEGARSAHKQTSHQSSALPRACTADGC